MAIKALQKPVRPAIATTVVKASKKVDKFISKGGSLANHTNEQDDHRLTLRIPQWLMTKIDIKRKERVGTISRNLYILEVLEKATK